MEIIHSYEKRINKLKKQFLFSNQKTAQKSSSIGMSTADVFLSATTFYLNILTLLWKNRNKTIIYTYKHFS